MELRAEITKDGVVLAMESEEGETMECAALKPADFRQLLAAIDALDDAVMNRSVGEVVLLARTAE